MFLLLHYFCRWLPWFCRCWLRWFDDDVDCDHLMMMLVVVMSSEQRLPLVRLPWIFPFLFQPTLHTISICMDGDDQDHHDNHLYFDDQMMAMISLILIIRWCKILKAVVNFILYVLRVLNCFIVSANLEIWSTSVKYYNSLMMMIVRWHCRNVKFSLFSLSMQRFINTNRESRNSTTWPRCVRRRKLEKKVSSLDYQWSSTKKSGWNNLELSKALHLQELISSYPTDDTANVKKIAESINQRL